MKKILLIVILSVFTLAVYQGKVQAQVTVTVKPVPPDAKMPIPKKPGSNYELIPGHWIWHRPSKMYAWVGPHWVPKVENKKWAPGHWEEKPNGWKWIPGRWERMKKGKYFFE